MNLILIAVISLGAIALVLAAILYVASKKFAVYEARGLLRWEKCFPRLIVVDVAIPVVADLPTLASKPVRWMVNSAP